MRSRVSEPLVHNGFVEKSMLGESTLNNINFSMHSGASVPTNFGGPNYIVLLDFTQRSEFFLMVLRRGSFHPSSGP